jgi:hypothetical protein
MPPRRHDFPLCAFARECNTLPSALFLRNIARLCATERKLSFKPGNPISRRALASLLNPQEIFLNRQTTWVLRSIGKSSVNSKFCAIIAPSNVISGLKVTEFRALAKLRKFRSAILRRNILVKLVSPGPQAQTSAFNFWRVPVRAYSLLLLTMLALSTPVHAQVQFNISFDATASTLTVDERAALSTHVQAAGALWLRELDIAGARSIEVEIGINDARPTANGGSVTSVFVAVVGGRDMFEQGMAGELRTGVDPNSTTPDVRFTFNTNYLRNELWFDPNPSARTAPVPSKRTDAMSVVLHEFGHALAYNGFAALATGQPPATFWSPFDRWMQPGDPVLFNGPRVLSQNGSAPDLTRNNIFHWANSGLFHRLAAITPAIIWQDGAPLPPMSQCEITAIDAAQVTRLPTAALIDELMNGVVYIRGNRYVISPLDRALLDDVGLPRAIFRNGFE